MDLIESKQASATPTRHPWEIARKNIALRFLKKLAPFRCVVDIGSGDAYISGAIATAYPNAFVYAVDINYSEEIKQALKAEHAQNLFLANDIASVDHNNWSKWEVILLMDVLEHIQNPNVFLQELMAHPSVNAHSTFFITVPAHQALFNEHDRMLKHFKRYSRRELVAFLKQNNMMVSQSGYLFQSLLPVRVFEMLTGKNHSSGHLASWKGNRWPTAFIVLLFKIEFITSYFLSRLNIHLPGLSCYCLCRPLP